jgi:hypothetical protein
MQCSAARRCASCSEKEGGRGGEAQAEMGDWLGEPREAGLARKLGQASFQSKGNMNATTLVQILYLKSKFYFFSKFVNLGCDIFQLKKLY